jgi:hypothetical protein
MTIAQTAILVATNMFVLGALVGLFVRRRLRLVSSFSIYLVAVLYLSTMVGVWPERFNTWGRYWFNESVYTVLKVGVALELTVQVFQAFPSARRAARSAFLIVLVVTVIAAWQAPMGSPETDSEQRKWADLVLALHPRITNGTAWLFGALFALILYYRLPLHPLHKAIAFGFMAYLLFFTFALDQVKRSDFARLTLVSYASSVGYALVAGYWAWAAWRRDPAPPVDPDVVRRLQPWDKPPPREP